MRSAFDHYLMERPDASRLMGVDFRVHAVTLCIGRVIAGGIVVEEFQEVTLAEWDEMKCRVLQ